MNPEHSRSLRIQSIIILIALVLQYILGMYTNLFVQFPDGVTGGQAWEFAWSQGVLASHIILGILLLIGSIVFVARVFAFRADGLKLPSIIGLISILLAGASGAIFVGMQADAYSYAMSILFLIAFGAYGWCMARSVQTI